MTDARLTQAALEQWLTTNPQLQLTQTAVEHWATVPTTSVQAVVTQIALEQWVSVPADTGGGGGGPVVPGPSDPMWDVPTPTGTLQGVAAFNWDGAVWQPAGRAGPSVATSTGVLQGVAAFTGGPSWAPSGRAGPGVATPTGVLDGVAVHTWSGSQWTPPGGSPSPSTPAGALRGVAAFDWDGAAWQPAGQAGPDVPTPYGVLQGVARFSWTGTAWAAVGAPSLSLDFMTPGALDPRVTFTRASTATYTDASGTIQTAASNAPRWDYDPMTHALRGVLIEEARTNLLLNSVTLGTQGVVVTAQAYTLSFYGPGTITKSGAATGALVGTGVGQRVSQTFTPTAGTLTCTVTGSVTNAQIEAGGFGTSWISTAGVAATRAQDLATLPLGVWYVAPGGSWFMEFIRSVPNNGNYMRLLQVSSGDAATQLFTADGPVVGQFENAGLLPTVNTFPLGTVARGVSTWAVGMAKVCLNGGAIASSTGLTNGYPGLSGPMMLFQTTIPSQSHTGYLRRIQYWPRVLSDAEMQAVTS
jgi:hypothetical protein